MIGIHALLKRCRLSGSQESEVCVHGTGLTNDLVFPSGSFAKFQKYVLAENEDNFSIVPLRCVFRTSYRFRFALQFFDSATTFQ